MQASAQTRAPAEAAADFPSQGERRRSQIVAIAAHLVVAGGPESVTHAAVAERAGIHRTAVYKYFPSRYDLLAAISLTYQELHAQRLTLDESLEGVRALVSATPKRVPLATRLLLERLWDERDWTQAGLELRLANAILVRDSELLGRLHDAVPALAERLTVELDEPLHDLGLDPIQVRIVADAILAVQYHATAEALKGNINRAEAIELTYQMGRAAIRAFVD